VSAALDWNDRDARAAWLADVAGRCKDAVAIAEDQTLSIDKRRLGPRRAPPARRGPMPSPANRW
jgi:hypothetical protein